MKKYGILILFIFLFSFGFEKTFVGLNLHHVSTATSLLGVGAAMVLAAFFVPFLLLCRALINRLGASWPVFWTALFSGLFMSTIFSSFANEFLDAMWLKVLDPQTQERWSAALTGPFSEEIIKAAVAVLVLALFPYRQFRDYLVAGLGVGIGFQIMEDIIYVQPKADEAEALNEVMPQVLTRLSGSLASHWTYTAIIVTGIYLLFRGRRALKGLAYVLLPVVLHFVWNSPLAEEQTKFHPLPAILSTATLLLFFLAVQDVWQASGLPAPQIVTKAPSAIKNPASENPASDNPAVENRAIEKQANENQPGESELGQPGRPAAASEISSAATATVAPTQTPTHTATPTPTVTTVVAPPLPTDPVVGDQTKTVE